jgi:hypothetical protein
VKNKEDVFYCEWCWEKKMKEAIMDLGRIEITDAMRTITCWCRRRSGDGNGDGGLLVVGGGGNGGGEQRCL